MASDPGFEAGAPFESMGTPQTPARSTPRGAASSGTKLVDIYTAMLFVAAIFLLVGSLAMAWEKQQYGELFGNSWRIPPDYQVQLHDSGNTLDTNRFFRV